MCKRARESICPGDYCECSKFSAIAHGMTSSPSMSLGFTRVWIMNLSGDHEMKKFPKENDTQSIEKFMLTIVWNPRGFHLIKILENGRKLNTGYHITEIL
jgi:hypothetical protein